MKDREDCSAAVHGVPKSWTQLSDRNNKIQMHIYLQLLYPIDELILHHYVMVFFVSCYSFLLLETILSDISIAGPALF